MRSGLGQLAERPRIRARHSCSLETPQVVPRRRLSVCSRNVVAGSTRSQAMSLATRSSTPQTDPSARGSATARSGSASARRIGSVVRNSAWKTLPQTHRLQGSCAFAILTCCLSQRDMQRGATSSQQRIQALESPHRSSRLLTPSSAKCAAPSTTHAYSRSNASNIAITPAMPRHRPAQPAINCSSIGSNACYAATSRALRPVHGSSRPRRHSSKTLSKLAPSCQRQDPANTSLPTACASCKSITIRRICAYHPLRDEHIRALNTRDQHQLCWRSELLCRRPIQAAPCRTDRLTLPPGR